MELVHAVAENIRRVRKRQKLSIDRTAELTGVSKSMLGQIERELVNPTVAVLEKIARGLHVSVAELVEFRGEEENTLYRAVDVTAQRLQGGKVIVHPLFPFDADSRCESCEMNLFITGEYASPDQIPGSRVYVTVLSGVLDVITPDGTWHLESRDSLVFSGARPYRLVNQGNTTVHLVRRIHYAK
ncbi:MAG: helix-turn-helix domain-containing protein [Oscillospiraceae bacterium]|nr:helix-turn-helix domain-containing protein [Oscillospiraceae bacterium]